MNFTLREWRIDDAESLAKQANNPNIAANLRNVFPFPYSLDAAEFFINDCIANEGKKQIVRAVVVDGKAVGTVSVIIQDDIYEKSAEIGYWLGEDYWNRGIMSEAVKMICKEAFSKFDIVRIHAGIFDYNIGSKRVLEKAGFTYEGTMRNGIYKNGKVHSYCMYSILREEMEI
ncbi:MAG: GNAT family N-acetyltransferase [Faecalibacterium sp.]|nr:GNAT family N-acetyltransferase [Ruminococcus sp.]MCM1392560.1 GNAT family N-acetyltransferase [Ruminococcus sp.]MCM1485635.1 GNAT family N-acetyltransferase [Faecalibacterium sp.]